MTEQEVLGKVIDQLEQHKIPYMVVGSYASSLHGVPRQTRDGDLVIQPDKESLRRFIDSLGVDFYADYNMAIDAMRHCSMFNVIHLPTGFKVDFIFLKPRPYSQQEFRRRALLSFLQKERWVVSPEDVILTKLEWVSMSDSERQLNDVVGVARVQRDHLDIEYMRKWAKVLEIEDLLNKVLALVNKAS